MLKNVETENLINLTKPDLNNLKGGDKVKIRVAYMPDETDKKKQLETAVKEMFPDTESREIKPKDGYLHTVLTVPKPTKPD